MIEENIYKFFGNWSQYCDYNNEYEIYYKKEKVKKTIKKRKRQYYKNFIEKELKNDL